MIVKLHNAVDLTMVDPTATRTVSFYPSVQVLEIDHFRDYSPHQRTKIWHSKSDYVAMKAAIAVALKRKGKFTETQRGLEARTKKGAAHRQRNRQLGRAAVLQEQFRQNVEGIRDDVKLAEAYQVISAECLLDAQELGYMDQEEVEKLQQLTVPRFRLFRRAHSMEDDSKQLGRSEHNTSNRRVGRKQSSESLPARKPASLSSSSAHSKIETNVRKSRRRSTSKSKPSVSIVTAPSRRACTEEKPVQAPAPPQMVTWKRHRLQVVAGSSSSESPVVISQVPVPKTMDSATATVKAALPQMTWKRLPDNRSPESPKYQRQVSAAA